MPESMLADDSSQPSPTTKEVACEPARTSGE